MKKIAIYFFAAIIAFLFGYYLNYFGSEKLGLRFKKVFEWEGRVDGLDLLKIKDRDVFVEHIKDKNITNMKYKFFKSVGIGRYFLKKNRGRGTISIYQFPFEINNFCLSIILDDTNFGGDEVYKFSLFEMYSDRSWENEEKVREIFGWSGVVDKREILEINFHLKDVNYIHVSGSKSVAEDKYFFSEKIGDVEYISVLLKKIFGRGSVDIVDVWKDGVKVSIFDPYRGSSFYEFILYEKR